MIRRTLRKSKDDNNDDKIDKNIDNKKNIDSDSDEYIPSESDESDSVYNKLVSLDTEVGREVLENFSGKYSTNTKYLKDTQKLMKHLKDMMVDKHMINNMTDFWMNIKTNKKFVETYQYLEFERFSYLNYSTVFLTWLTILNLFSPLLQVITPILLLLLPFLLMRSISSHSGVTISNYIEGLKYVLSNNSLGKLILNFNSGSIQQKFQCIMFVSMYFYMTSQM